MLIKKIYLDMDGVLCNFDKRYKELYGKKTKDNFRNNWPDFIQTKQFETLEWMPGARVLLDFIEFYPVKIEILSSSGGSDYHEYVKAQKELWLLNHDINYYPNIVPGKGYKKVYASPENILIDDTQSIIDDFNEAGGIGIHHQDIGKTIDSLKYILDVD